MKKIWNRIVTISLILLLLFFLSAYPSTADVVTQSGTCGDGVTWKLTRSSYPSPNSTTLIISGSGEMNDYYLSDANRRPPWYDQSQTTITDIRIESGVTYIGKDAFAYRSGIKRIIVSSTVTKIGSDAFLGATAAVGAWDATIDGYPNLCAIFYSGDISDWCAIQFSSASSNPLKLIGSSTLTRAGSWYIKNEKVTEISIPTGIEEIKPYSFSGGSMIEKITVPSSVYVIGKSAFAGCSNATIILPSTITRIESDAFTGTKQPTFTKDYFFSAKSMSGVEQYSIQEGTKTIAEYAFQNATKLKTITIPESVVNIGKEAFSGTAYYKDAKNWKSGTLYLDNNLIKANVEQAGNVVVAADTRVIADSAFDQCSAVTAVTIPDSVISIGYNAFTDCTGLKSIRIPKSVSEIKDGTFRGCIRLRELSFSEELQKIGKNAFTDCISLTDVALPNSLKSIGEYAFSGCAGLTQITIPRSVTEIGKYAFDGCDDFTTIYGYRNSYAETYAQENGYTFIPLSDPGDMDGDGVLSDEDAVYLLYHIYFPDDYPTSQNCDFDGDGAVTDADATYLLYHIYFPEDYPLH